MLFKTVHKTFELANQIEMVSFSMGLFPSKLETIIKKQTLNCIDIVFYIVAEKAGEKSLCHVYTSLTMKNTSFTDYKLTFCKVKLLNEVQIQIEKCLKSLYICFTYFHY